MPDPNQGLQPRDAGALPPGTGPQGLPPLTPLPSDAPGVGSGTTGRASPPKDDLGALIATLPQPSQPPASSAANSKAPAKNESSSSTASGTASGPYYLQVGSFRVLEDAESLRARILLMGMPVEIQRAEVNGMQVNRVRVGPFAKLDDMNRTRARLGEEKISSTVVRQ